MPEDIDKQKVVDIQTKHTMSPVILPWVKKKQIQPEYNTDDSRKLDNFSSIIKLSKKNQQNEENSNWGTEFCLTLLDLYLLSIATPINEDFFLDCNVKT